MAGGQAVSDKKFLGSLDKEESISQEGGIFMNKRYMISDAAKLVDVETHVLRYWEEELELSILRNEMGHRYYTDGDINLFRNVKI